MTTELPTSELPATETPGIPPVVGPTTHDSVWPVDTARASRVAVGTAVAAGLVTTLLLDLDTPSIGFVLTGAAVAAAILVARRRVGVRSAAPIVVVLGLLVVATVRDSGWLVFAAVALAVLVAAVALVRGSSWTALVLAPFVTLVAARRVGPWLYRERPAVRVARSAPIGRIAVVTVSTVVLVVVFGVLFATADDRFADILGRAVPSIDLDFGFDHVVLFVVAVAVVLCAQFVAANSPELDGLAPATPAPRPRWEWAVPVVALDIVFGLFVAVQASYLFGGDERVAATDGLTYANYARHGFWQLLVVTLAVLVVVAFLVRKVNRDNLAHRKTAQAALGALCILTLVVVASAWHRMALYENEFGFTRLRVSVMAVELWLGLAIVLVMVAGVTWNARWLPRTVLAAAVVGVAAMAAVNPDAYIAERNVDRYTETGDIDVAYLATLSADAVPALDRLPADIRGCVLGPIVDRLHDDRWWDFNSARSQARDVIGAGPLSVCARPTP